MASDVPSVGSAFAGGELGESLGAIATAVRPAPGVLWLESDSTRLVCELGDGQWQTVDGYARYETTELPGRRSLTTLAGFGAIVLTGPITIDGIAGGRRRSVEREIEVLEEMAGIRADRVPPLLRVYGVEHDTGAYAKRRFVLLAPEWDDDEDATIWHGNDRVRVSATLTLQAVDDDTTVSRLAGTEPFRRVPMRAGETLRDFARRTLDDARRWRDILSLNRDNPKCPTSPETKVRSERRLKLPPRDR